VSELPPPGTPAGRFADDMAAVGAQVRAEPGRLMYDVVAVGGALAGQTVSTGVSLAEVHTWPQAPPHWVHLPDTVDFAATNADNVDCPPGWRRHSREFTFTDMSIPPALAWLRHVRGLLSLAISAAA
jgi:hypothetical protein